MVQISLFRQLLLGKTSLLAVVADLVAQYATMIQFRWHSSFTKTGSLPHIHPLYCVLCLHLSAGTFKKVHRFG